MKTIQLFSVTPAPYGDDYRLVESFDSIDGAIEALEVLEKVNVMFNTYRIMAWTNNEIIYDSWKK